MFNLVNYSSSEDSDNEASNEKATSALYETSSTGHVARDKLPLPGDIVGMFEDRSTVKRDNPVEHAGRQRSFPHIEGNWATLVYAKYEPDAYFSRLQDELFKCLRPHEFQPMDDYHVSLSRTVTIRHHWIRDITDSLQEKFAGMPDCACEITGVSVLTNDEKSRSFLVLDTSSADNCLESYVSVVDECFKQYKLQEYYKPPKFHISIGWCLDDVTSSIQDKTKCKLKDILNTALQEDGELQYFCFDEIHMKTGNKHFTFPLEEQT